MLRRVEDAFLCVNLTMLLGSHGAGIDVHVGVNLDCRDLETGRLEEQARGGGCNMGLNGDCGGEDVRSRAHR